MPRFTPQEAIWEFRNALWQVAHRLGEEDMRKTDQKIANMLERLGYALESCQKEYYNTSHVVVESIMDSVAEFWKEL